MESNPAKSMSARLKLNRVSLVVRLALVLFVVSCAVQVAGSLAGIFSYRDDKGIIHFTDDLSKIPKHYRESEKGVRKHHEARGAHRATPVPSSPIELPGLVSKIQEIQIPLIPVGGGNFLVDTVLNGRIKARLMLDTGASLITLTEGDESAPCIALQAKAEGLLADKSFQIEGWVLHVSLGSSDAALTEDGTGYLGTSIINVLAFRDD